MVDTPARRLLDAHFMRSRIAGCDLITTFTPRQVVASLDPLRRSGSAPTPLEMQLRLVIPRHILNEIDSESATTLPWDQHKVRRMVEVSSCPYRA